jgi:cell division septation protein DedD
LDSLVKERLTGAIILVVLIVLLVPELLSGPSRSAPPPQASLATSSEEAPLRSYTINLADDPHTGGTAGAASSSAQATGPAQPTAITESLPANPAQPTEAVPDNAPEQASAPPAQTSQIPEPPPHQDIEPAPRHSSSRPAQTLAQAPQPPAQVPQRSVTSPEKPAAAQQHSAAAERTEPAGTASGWMVQLGVFSVQTNAERLAQELKTQGFHALVSQIGGTGGHPMWRVRAGPVAEHAAAEQLSARLRAAGHAGSVVPR